MVPNRGQIINDDSSVVWYCGNFRNKGNNLLVDCGLVMTRYNIRNTSDTQWGRDIWGVVAVLRVQKLISVPPCLAIALLNTISCYITPWYIERRLHLDLDHVKKLPTFFIPAITRYGKSVSDQNPGRYAALHRSSNGKPTVYLSNYLFA